MKSHSARTLQVTYKTYTRHFLSSVFSSGLARNFEILPRPPSGSEVPHRCSARSSLSAVGRVRGLELPRPCARRRAKRLLARSGAGEKTHLLSVRHGTEAEGRMRQCAPGRAGPAEAASDWGQIRDASQRDRGRVCREWVGF